MSKVILPGSKLVGGPYVMGVLRIAPVDEVAATPRALAMVEAGADILDVGAEMGDAVSPEEEMARVVPVIAALRAATRAPIAIRTMKPSVALAAAHVGAVMWNDANALRAPGALESAASLHQPVVLSHRGELRGADVVEEVTQFLKERAAISRAKGIEDIWVDPGLRHGKTHEQKRALIAAIARLREETNCPVLVDVALENAEAIDAVTNGADMLRVHDVANVVDALRAARIN